MNRRTRVFRITLALAIALLMTVCVSSALAAARTVPEREGAYPLGDDRKLAGLNDFAWVTRDGATYYENAKGEYAVGLWTIGRKKYIFDNAGRLQNQGGWIQYNGDWYYTESGGAILEDFSKLSEVRIPKKVDHLTAWNFRGAKRTFMIRCDAGSYAESFARAYGLQYTTGTVTVRGCEISSVSGKVNWIVENYITADMSDWQKAWVLHNWLIYNAHYDYSYSRYDADDVLIDGNGVCDSYAKAYCLLLSAVGIENRRITGDTYGGEGHAWNLVRLNGQWYHVDCTWDDPNDSGNSVISGYECNDYFQKNDAFIRQSRYFDEDISADANYAGFVNWGKYQRYYGPDGQLVIGFMTRTETVLVRDSLYSPWHEEQLPMTYYFDEQGRMCTGWLELGGNTYYFKENGWMAQGVESIDGQTYYFEESGILRQNRWYQGTGGGWYCTDADGNWLYGWVQDNGKWYYIDRATGMRTGWNQVGGKWYYMNGKGEMQTGWVDLGGSRYLMDGSGAMVTGWAQVNGKWYYFARSGEMRTGWLQDGKIWYYLNSAGEMQTDWQQIGGKWYLFDGSGVMQTGWVQRGGVWYDFDENGAMRTGWFEEKKNGRSRWYWFDDSGAMATGWVVVGERWEFFDGSGVWQYSY